MIRGLRGIKGVKRRVRSDCEGTEGSRESHMKIVSDQRGQGNSKKRIGSGQVNCHK